MRRTLAIALIFFSIVSVVVCEQTFLKSAEERMMLVQSSLESLQNDSKRERKEQAVKFAEKFLERKAFYQDKPNASIDEKIERYAKIARRYFPEALYGPGKVTVMLSGKVAPGNITELYPSVYEVPIKVVVSFQSSVLPYSLLAQSISRLCRVEGVLLTDLKLSASKMDLVFSVLGITEK